MTTTLDRSQEQTSGGTIDKQSGEGAKPKTNVGKLERVGSSAAGGLLAWHGLRRGGLSGVTLAGVGALLIKRGATGHCEMYDKLGVDTNHNDARDGEKYFHRGIHVVQAFTIQKPAAELFQYWRNFENLPRIMSHLKEVTVLDEKRSHWKAVAPAGGSVEWDAEIIREDPNQLIAWKSLPGAQVDNAGSVRFIDTGDRGTEVRVTLDYVPPAGRLGWLVAKLFGQEPNGQIREDLRQFKQMMEAGEVATTKGQPRGRCEASRRRDAASNGNSQ